MLNGEVENHLISRETCYEVGNLDSCFIHASDKDLYGLRALKHEEAERSFVEA